MGPFRQGIRLESSTEVDAVLAALQAAPSLYVSPEAQAAVRDFEAGDIERMTAVAGVMSEAVQARNALPGFRAGEHTTSMRISDIGLSRVVLNGLRIAAAAPMMDPLVAGMASGMLGEYDSKMLEAMPRMD